MIACAEYRDEIARSLGLDGLRTGRHIVRNGSGMKTGERWILRLWYCLIQIGCDAKAIIAVVEPRDSNQCLAGFFRVCQKNLTDSVFAEIPTQEAMPDFDSITLGTSSGTLRLDGVAYSIGIESVALRAFIEFANPVDERLMTLEKDILSTVQALANATGKSVVSDFHQSVELCRPSSAGRRK